MNDPYIKIKSARIQIICAEVLAKIDIERENRNHRKKRQLTTDFHERSKIKEFLNIPISMIPTYLYNINNVEFLNRLLENYIDNKFEESTYNFGFYNKCKELLLASKEVNTIFITCRDYFDIINFIKD